MNRSSVHLQQLPNGVRKNRLLAPGALIAVILIALQVTTRVSVAAGIEDKRVDSFETGLETTFGYAVGEWIDSDRLVAQALQEKVHVLPGIDDRGPTWRVVLVNFRTRKVTTLAQNAAIRTFDRETLDLVVGRLQRDDVARQIHIQPDDSIKELARFPPGAELPNTFAEYPKKGSARLLDHKSDGYLFDDTAEAGVTRTVGTLTPTVWIRPGRPPLRLPIPFVEIGNPTFVPFLGKYLLNDRDSQMSSSTNAKLTQPLLWKRPYTLAPYRLLSSDGRVEEIPYPAPIIAAGIKDFNQLMFTRRGIAVTAWDAPDFGIYLYQGGHVYRLVGGGTTVLGMHLGSLNMTGVTAATVSPDGCRISYLHYDVPASAVAMWMPRKLAIVDVCKEVK